MTSGAPIPHEGEELDPGVPLTAQEHRRIREVVRILDYVREAASSVNDIHRPVDGSFLWESFHLSETFPPFDEIKRLILTAETNLQTVRYLVGGDQAEDSAPFVLPPAGYYSLIRSAIECTALALWLMDSDDPHICLARTCRAEFKNIADGEKCSTEVARVAPHSPALEDIRKRADRHRDRLREIAKAADLSTEEAEKKLPAVTDLLKAAQKLHPLSQLQASCPDLCAMPAFAGSWEATWQMCSGAAHGRGWVEGTVYNKSNSPGPDGEGLFEFRALNIVPIEASTQVAGTMLSIATAQFSALSGVPSGRRPCFIKIMAPGDAEDA